VKADGRGDRNEPGHIAGKMVTNVHQRSPAHPADAPIIRAYAGRGLYCHASLGMESSGSARVLRDLLLWERNGSGEARSGGVRRGDRDRM